MGKLILQKQLISRYRKVTAKQKLRQKWYFLCDSLLIRKIGWGSPKLVVANYLQIVQGIQFSKIGRKQENICVGQQLQYFRERNNLALCL